MNVRLAEKGKEYKRRAPSLLYLVKSDDKVSAGEDVVYRESGLFYIFVIAIILTCLGILLNIGLKVQNINYRKGIYEINEMISLENERNDRLQLEIAELKSPDRIIGVAENDLNMNIADDSRVIKISSSGLENNEKIYNYMAKSESRVTGNYDSFLGTIYYVQDIVLVVSEGVLTFFIP
ncbi:MAG: cell division protein FtsL [Actinomycetota bacterium]|nr:cell division protein FtsL [Actinomycetota bacterium]